MKKLTKEEMQKVVGGNANRGFIPCSTGKCGPNNEYNCSVEYDVPTKPDEHPDPTCCCGHSDYNDDCMAA